jgi:hypothetical protein
VSQTELAVRRGLFNAGRRRGFQYEAESRRFLLASEAYCPPGGRGWLKRGKGVHVVLGMVECTWER